jgi:hypothetical protein
VQQHVNVALVLKNQVQASDTAIDNAVLHVLRHVLGAHEEKVNVGVAAVSLEYPLPRLLWRNATGLEQRPRRLT